MSINSGAGRVFGWLANLSAVTGMLTWPGICFIYLRFYSGVKAQGIDRSTLPFSSPLQPYAAWYGVISCTTVCLLSGWQLFLRDGWATDAFVTDYLPLVIFPTLYIIGRVLHRQALVNLHEMDFKTGVDEAIADSYDESPPKNVWEKFWVGVCGK
ncbi:hypothetical protein FRC12_001910 [Ceratobasidium sp. 428]|nr:hypothetical protein FRC12_001910 [Ceratobasidium sp. 428]